MPSLRFFSSNKNAMGMTIGAVTARGTATANGQLSGVAHLTVAAAMAEGVAKLQRSEIASIVMQAVVKLGEKIFEGHIVLAVAPAWFEIIKLLENDPNALFSIPPRKLEEIIAGAYERR